MIKNIFKMVILILLAALSALNYAIFIFPNKFAPAGIDGICTMIQDITSVNIGYLSLIVNIPLIILSFFILSRDFAIKSTIYIISFSISSIFLGKIDLSSFVYITDTGSSIVLAPIIAGVIRGLLYYVTLKLNGSSGGVDIIAALIKHKKPFLDLMNTIFFFNVIVALCSYFVYGMQLEPVICSILYFFITTSVNNNIRVTTNENIKYEIITKYADKFCEELSLRFHQSATILDAHGAYSGLNTKMVVCVVDKKTSPYIEDLILRIPDCIVFKSMVGNSLSGVTYK